MSTKLQATCTRPNSWFLDFLLAKMYVATVETLLHPSRRGIHSSQGRIPLWEGWFLSFNRTWVYSKVRVSLEEFGCYPAKFLTDFQIFFVLEFYVLITFFVCWAHFLCNDASQLFNSFRILLYKRDFFWPYRERQFTNVLDRSSWTAWTLRKYPRSIVFRF